mmetsp:Transcript_16613/g.47845  ORF Transcript_16613/g.47845 Transcript_16613/m.47845 type:complete len:104 (+) Transcript_16613:488-799(+)
MNQPSKAAVKKVAPQAKNAKPIHTISSIDSFPVAVGRMAPPKTEPTIGRMSQNGIFDCFELRTIGDDIIPTSRVSARASRATSSKAQTQFVTVKAYENAFIIS